MTTAFHISSRTSEKQFWLFPLPSCMISPFTFTTPPSPGPNLTASESFLLTSSCLQLVSNTLPTVFQQQCYHFHHLPLCDHQSPSHHLPWPGVLHSLLAALILFSPGPHWSMIHIAVIFVKCKPLSGH